MAFLKYEISVVGVDKVRQAMRAVEREAEGAGRRGALRDPSRGGRAGAGAANTNASVREAEARYRAQETAATRAARAEERAHARAEREKTRISEREARNRNRAEMALNRQRSSALYAQFREEERARNRATGIAAAEKRRGRAELARTTKGVLGGVASTVSSVGRTAIAATGLAGGAIFAASAHSAMARNAAAADLANQLVGREASAKTLAAKKTEILDAVSATRGFSAPEVMAGMSAFQARAGEGEATMKMAPIMTDMALASGADIEDLGQMYAAVYASIRQGAGGAAKSVDQIIGETERMGRIFAAMGQIGAIEIKDIAQIGPQLAATALAYEGGQAENIQRVAALAQIAVQTGGAEDAREGGTSVARFVDDLVEHREDVNAMLVSSGGKSIYADKAKTKLRALPDLLPDLMAATGGNLEKMGTMFNVRGARAIRGFTTKYQDAYQAARKGGASEKEARAAGKRAVSARFAEFGGIEQSKAEVGTKANFKMAQADKMLDERMRELTTAVGDKLLPQIIEMIPAISKLVPAFVNAAEMFVRAVKYISEAPVEAAFAGLGALFAIEIGKAGIAAAIQKAIAAFVAGGAVAPAAAGAAGTAAAAGTVASKVDTILSIVSGRAANVAAGAAAGAPTAGGLAAGGLAAGLAMPAIGMAGLGAMVVGAQNERNIVENRGGEIASRLESQTKGMGVWDAAMAESQAYAELDRTRKTTGGGTGSGADVTALKAAISDVVTANLNGGAPQRADKELAAAMLELKNVIQSTGGFSPSVGINTSNTPTVPSVK